MDKAEESARQLSEILTEAMNLKNAGTSQAEVVSKILERIKEHYVTLRNVVTSLTEKEQKTTEAEKAANASLKTIKKLQNDAEEKAKKFVDRTEEELNTEIKRLESLIRDHLQTYANNAIDKAALDRSTEENTKLREIQNTHSACAATVALAEKKMNTEKEEVQRLRGQLSDLQTVKEDLKKRDDELTQLRLTHNDCGTTASFSEGKIKELQEETTRLKKIEATHASCAFQTSFSEDKIKELNKEAAELKIIKDNHASCGPQALQSQERISDLKEEATRLRKIENTHASCSTTASFSDGKIKELKDEVTQLKIIKDNHASCSSEASLLQEKVNSLNKETTRLEQVEKAHKQCASASEVSTLNSNLRTAKDDLQQRTEELSQLRHSSGVTEASQKEDITRLEEVEKAHEQCTSATEVSTLNSNLRTAKDDLQQRTEELSQLRHSSSITEASQKKDITRLEEVEKAHQKCASASEVSELKSAKQNLQDQVNKLNDLRRTDAGAASSSTSKINELKKDITRLEKVEEAHKQCATASQVSHLETQNERLRDIEVTHSSCPAHGSLTTSLTQQVQTTTQQVQTITAERDSARSERDSAREERDSLEAARAKLEQDQALSTANLNNAINRATTAEATNKALKSKLETLNIAAQADTARLKSADERLRTYYLEDQHREDLEQTLANWFGPRPHTVPRVAFVDAAANAVHRLGEDLAIHMDELEVGINAAIEEAVQNLVDDETPVAEIVRRVLRDWLGPRPEARPSDTLINRIRQVVNDQLRTTPRQDQNVPSPAGAFQRPFSQRPSFQRPSTPEPSSAPEKVADDGEEYYGVSPSHRRAQAEKRRAAAEVELSGQDQHSEQSRPPSHPRPETSESANDARGSQKNPRGTGGTVAPRNRGIVTPPPIRGETPNLFDEFENDEYETIERGHVTDHFNIVDRQFVPQGPLPFRSNSPLAGRTRFVPTIRGDMPTRGFSRSPGFNPTRYIQRTAEQFGFELFPRRTTEAPVPQTGHGFIDSQPAPPVPNLARPAIGPPPPMPAAPPPASLRINIRSDARLTNSVLNEASQKALRRDGGVDRQRYVNKYHNMKNRNGSVYSCCFMNKYKVKEGADESVDVATPTPCNICRNKRLQCFVLVDAGTVLLIGPTAQQVADQARMDQENDAAEQAQQPDAN